MTRRRLTPEEIERSDAPYRQYLDAWLDVANQRGVSERSPSQAAAAQEIEYRLNSPQTCISADDSGQPRDGDRP
jgi:hypothetical protein